MHVVEGSGSRDACARGFGFRVQGCLWFRS